VLFIEDLTAVVLWFLLTVIAVNLLFLCFIFYRRAARKRYFSAKDAGRARYASVVNEFLQGQHTVEKAVALLSGARSIPEQDAVRDVLFSHTNESNTAQVTELLFALGYVERWARDAFGRGRAKKLLQMALRKEKPAVTSDVRQSILNPLLRLRLFAVPRAVAMTQLGRLGPDFSLVFAAEALRDSASDVRRVGTDALGRHRHPAAIPLLVEELRKALEVGNDVSLRSAKSALTCYQLDDLQHFVRFLTHPNRRMRFFVVDCAREICNRAAAVSLLNKNDFSLDFYETFLSRVVVDEFADVRARSAAVIKHFRDARSLAALRTLLRDENEFVRLHAVRACADRYYGDLIPLLVERLSDARWRVRDAAAAAIRTFGSSGTNELYRYFVGCPDQYASEQVAEEIQREGLMEDVLAALASGGADAQLAYSVCQKMVGMGKTSLLLGAVTSPGFPEEQRLMLLDILSMYPTPELVAVLQALAEAQLGEVSNRAAVLLQQHEAASAVAAAAGGEG
jgi:HEAT repeat protein